MTRLPRFCIHFLLASGTVLGLSACADDPVAVSAGPDEPVIRQDLVVGSGSDTVRPGDTVLVNYELSLLDGTFIESSLTDGVPFEIQLTTQDSCAADRFQTTIEGWVEGLSGMREGGRRRITVPPSKGYGSRQNGNIPANSTLVFNIDLLRIYRFAQPDSCSCDSIANCVYE